MKNYDMAKIRNLTLIGASGAGKTTLAEQMLFNAKATTRCGKINDGNTVMDFDAEEISRKMSMAVALGNLNWKDHRINIIDTPGYADFLGEQIAGLTASENIMVVLNASGGFEVGLELALENLSKFDKTKALIINRMDNEHADYNKTIDAIQDNTDYVPAPLLIPIGKEAQFEGVIDLVKGKAFIHDKPVDIPASVQDYYEESRMKLMEAVAETDEELLEKYFEEGELAGDDFINGVKNGIKTGALLPVLTCSADKNIGVNALMDAVIEYLPSPKDKNELTFLDKDEEKQIICSPDGDLIAYVFKSFSDPNIGDMAYVRVFSGSIKSGMEVYVPEKDSKDKIGGIYTILGKNRSDYSELRAGEIGGLVKLKVARGLNSIVNTNSNIRHTDIFMPTPVYWKSIFAVNQSDEDKIGTALNKLLDEDPTVSSDFNAETHENVLSGIGEQQLLLIIKKLKSRFKVEAELKTPIIPYKETIEGKAEVSYKHKKQSGGRGQYGEVYFRIGSKPRGEGFEFINSIVGGTIPSKFLPAIEKGCVETMAKGIIAGYKVVDVFVECYFGSYHDVDSSEMAFKIASSQALKAGFSKAKPILLEPIHEVQIIIPNEYMGDVMGDVSTRRGKIQGMEQKGKKQILGAHMPLAELLEYFPNLKSLTQGRGRFTQKFSHFEKVPHDIAQKVIAAYNEED